MALALGLVALGGLAAAAGSWAMLVTSRGGVLEAVGADGHEAQGDLGAGGGVVLLAVRGRNLRGYLEFFCQGLMATFRGTERPLQQLLCC